MSFLSDLAKKIQTNNIKLSIEEQYPTVSYQPATVFEKLFLTLVVMTTLLVFISFFKSITLIFSLMYYMSISVVFYLLYLIGGPVGFSKTMAFLLAVTFPSLAIITQFPGSSNDEPFIMSLFHCFIYLLKLMGICIIGALLIVGFLSDIEFLKGIHQFWGVKLSFILPLIIVGLFFYLRPHRVSSVFYVLRRLFHAPVRTAGLMAVFSLILFTIILIIRSGNYTLLPIYNLEIKMRTLFETIFYIRPRTKEFLIGYPFLIIAYLYVDSKISRLWIWFFNVMGTVGLLSVVNSFCHIHTPLEVSLYRTLLGFILGIFVAMIYILIYKGLSRFSYKRLL